MLLTQTNQLDCERLCRIDVLGLEDAPEHDQQIVYNEFKEQLTRSPHSEVAKHKNCAFCDTSTIFIENVHFHMTISIRCGHKS